MVLGRCMMKGKEHGHELWGRRSRMEVFLLKGKLSFDMR